MPIAIREAEVHWEGPLARGTGTLTSGSSALDQLAVTWASRTERPDGKTSPEELIAGAHASCFAMALALVLGDNKAPPERLTVSAACTLDEVDGAPRITTVQLTVPHRCPGSTRPSSSAPWGWRPISARSPTRCVAMLRSACEASSRNGERDRPRRAGRLGRKLRRMDVRLKRAYEPASPTDGYRVLIDRLWPRGVSREHARLDGWEKELAPSATLRQWFGHDPGRFEEFRRRYIEELRSQRPRLTALRRRARDDTLTLVYSAHDAQHNDAVVLAEVLRRGLPTRRT